MKSRSLYTCLTGITLAVVSGLLVEYLKDYPIPGKIWRFVLFTWGIIVEFMTKHIEIYWIVILILVLIFSFIAFMAFIKNKDRQNNEKAKNTEANKMSPRKSVLHNYTEELYNGILWRFSWRIKNNVWAIEYLRACCPIDKTPLLHYRCPRCNKVFYNSAINTEGFDEDKVEILILDNANRLIQKEQQDLLT